MRRIDPPNCRCTDCLLGDSRPARDGMEYGMSENMQKLKIQFKPGHDRPDLDMLYLLLGEIDRALEAGDRLDPNLVGLHNNLTYYLNNRPQEV